MNPESELNGFLLEVGNLYGSFIQKNYMATKVNERIVNDQRFILSKMDYANGQRMLYVVSPAEKRADVRIIAIEGDNGDLIFTWVTTKEEILVAVDLIFDYKQSIAIFD